MGLFDQIKLSAAFHVPKAAQQHTAALLRLQGIHAGAAHPLRKKAGKFVDQHRGGRIGFAAVLVYHNLLLVFE
jgi:hypothetical protein